jgi:hypothetical protein
MWSPRIGPHVQIHVSQSQLFTRDILANTIEESRAIYDCFHCSCFSSTSSCSSPARDSWSFSNSSPFVAEAATYGWVWVAGLVRTSGGRGRGRSTYPGLFSDPSSPFSFVPFDFLRLGLVCVDCLKEVSPLSKTMTGSGVHYLPSCGLVLST